MAETTMDRQSEQSKADRASCATSWDLPGISWK